MKQITCPHCGDTYPDFDVAHVCSKGPYAPKLKPKMNERIKQLAEQAKFIAEETINKKISKNAELDAFAEKFAELIIEETLKQVDERVYGRGENSWYYDDDKRWVRLHFGVEE